MDAILDISMATTCNVKKYFVNDYLCFCVNVEIQFGVFYAIIFNTEEKICGMGAIFQQFWPFDLEFDLDIDLDQDQKGHV